MVKRYAIELYSTHNEGKSVVAKRSIRTLKSQIYKYMTSISKNILSIFCIVYILYIDKLVIWYS